MYEKNCFHFIDKISNLEGLSLTERIKNRIYKQSYGDYRQILFQLYAIKLDTRQNVKRKVRSQKNTTKTIINTNHTLDNDTLDNDTLDNDTLDNHTLDNDTLDNDTLDNDTLDNNTSLNDKDDNLNLIENKDNRIGNHNENGNEKN